MDDKKEIVAAVLMTIAFLLMYGSVGNAEFYGDYTTAEVIRLIVAGVLLIPAFGVIIRQKINNKDE